jgi:hypothetical protein
MLKVANSVISASRITGVLPVVNGGTGVTTSTGTGNTVLSATPTLSGDVTLSTGNLVIGTAGKGVDFTATTSGSGTMTSELLADYEEGDWTPTGNGITFSTAIGRYTKIGRQVCIAGFVVFPATANASAALISSLPFTIANTTAARGGFTVGYTSYGATFFLLGNQNDTSLTMYTTAGADIFNINMSGAVVYFGGQYSI